MRIIPYARGLRNLSLLLVVFFSSFFSVLRYTDDQPPAPPKLTFTGELDLGVTYGELAV